MRHLVCAAVLAIAAPASAQIDISGNWISSEENLRPRGNAGIGDYTGLPLNDAGRLRADTWDASILSQRERQTEPHGVQYYQFRSPARIEKMLDPATRQLVAYTLCCEIGALERVVWLDGRPHPPGRRASLGRVLDGALGGSHTDRHDHPCACQLSRAQWRAGQSQDRSSSTSYVTATS